MKSPRHILLCGLAMLAAVGAATRCAAAFDLRAAIAQAKAGDTIRVPAGTYDGPIVIDKRITLLADGGAVLDGHGKGDVVQVRAAGVVLSGFRIRDSGDNLERENAAVTVLAPHVTVERNVLEDVLFGVYVKQGAGAVVRGNTIGGKDLDIARRGDAIKLWYSPDCLVDGNTVHDVRDVVIWFSKGVRITNNHVFRSRYGLHFMFCDDNTLIGNRLEDNSVGVYLMDSRRLVLRGNLLARNRGPSGYGLGLKDMDDVDAADNQIVGNRIGVYLDSSPLSLDVHNRFTRNLLAYNDTGIAMLPSVRRNLFQDNSFIDNQEQVAILGSGRLEGNAFTVNGRGNFWSDYKGFDQNHDGIGDLPYRSQDLFENLMDRDPKLRLFLYSPAQQALELASEAFPAVKPRPKLVDDAPLMRPVAPHLAAQASASVWPPAGAGAAMLALGSGAIALGRRERYRSRRAVLSRAARLGRLSGRSIPVVGTAPVLSVERLTKRFGRFVALDGLAFDLAPGTALALWGSNGAGKTTAIRCILGLIRSQGGTVRVAGRELRKDPKAVRAVIGYVPQESGFQGDLSALETLRLYARLKGVGLDRVAPLLAEVGLADHGAKRVANLSGGMRKRLALAAALLNDPPLLVLDEIAANLDTEARQSFMALLARLKAQGKTILFTSHRIDEVQSLADRVIVLDRGRIRHDCRPCKLSEVLGLHCEVKLLLDSRLIEPAISLLRTGGYAAQRNGRGIWVRVEPERKAGPIHLLARHQIVIDNFELETQDAEQSHVATSH